MKFSHSNRLMAATALLSVALIAYQVAIMQLLSFVQWSHFANMVISVALLGFGAAGTFLSLFRKKLIQHSEILLPLLMIFSGISMTTALWLSRSGFARFDSYLLFVERRQWMALLFNYLLFFLPFFSGAIALGIVFVKYVSSIGRFYFSNLAGSGIGALLVAGLAWIFLPAVFPVVISWLAIISGLMLMTVQNRKYVIPVLLIATTLGIYKTVRPVDLSLSEYKSLSRVLQLPAAKIELHKPGPYGYIQVVSAEALRYAPGLSLAFTGEVPVKKVVFNNGDWLGPVISWNPQDSMHLLDFTTMTLPFVLENRNQVLVLHAGTGLNVSHALSKNASHIDAVESHRGLMKLLLNELASDNDSLYYHHRVTTHITEPRTFLSATQAKYDLIQFPLLGSFGGGTGLYALKEEYSLTKEAFLKAWNLLTENGVISVSTWMDYPFRNPLKLAATLSELAHDIGVSIHSHLVAVRSWGTISFLLKKSPITAADITRIRSFCNEFFFDPVLLPGLEKHELSTYNSLSDSSFFDYMLDLWSGKKEKLYEEYDFHLKPATDNKPYFSQFLRWNSFPRLKEVFGSQSVSFLELGWLVSAITFLQISVLALLLIIVPLFKIGWNGKSKLLTLLYFGGLGVGYMLLEIILIQQFILFFGNPVNAAAWVIGIMLLSSGAGSYYSSRLNPSGPMIRKQLFVILALLLFYTFFLSSLLQTLVGLSMWLKLGFSFFIIALPAFFMGMPFPLGLKALSELEEKNIPWAWGINGCLSVVSAAMATLLAVEIGFTAVLLIAVFAYIISLASLFIYKL